MKEDFIHFLWKYRLFNTTEIFTTKGLRLEIFNAGAPNKDSGPDFSAARIKIGNTLWAGNVEIHMKSSDWFRHGHQTDSAYNNIILHVVMEHDREINDATNADIPVFEIRQYFDIALFYKYESILDSKSWIPCEKHIKHADNFIVINWLNRLLVERLENKSNEISQFYQYFEKKWDQTFYYFLARNFGFKVNSSPFALLAQITPYKILAKHKDDLTQLEAILFGQAGLLAEDFSDAYPCLLRREYNFLRHKYKLEPMDGSLWKFAKLRPQNFPTIRIAQFANLVHHSSHLFNKITHNSEVGEIKAFFDVQGSLYWSDHFRFDKPSSTKTKKLGTDAIENILINTIAPLKFVYGSENGDNEIRDQAISILFELSAEHNNITQKWTNAGIKPQNAGESQALIELKKYYCTPKKCLNCAIGHNLVRSTAASV
jgi:hypothetical protein